MNPSRRDFLKLATVGGTAAAVFGFDLRLAYAELRTLKIARANETRRRRFHRRNLLERHPQLTFIK